MLDRSSAPIRIHVTEAGAAPVDTPALDHLSAALACHLQRIACEGARAAWCRAPASQAWMESETGLKGWRAQVHPDTAHLIQVVEDLGLMVFDDG